VTIRSAPGEGTEVSLWLPAARDDAADAPRDGGAVPRGGGEAILVVEDDAVLRSAMVDVLESMGYAPHTVADGAEAVDRLRHSGPDIRAVLSELAMPGLGGEGLAREMARAWPDVPLILVTPAPDGAAPTATTKQVRHLPKPFSAEQLAHTLRAALE
jgi:CheY-like chemotaxis protein